MHTCFIKFHGQKSSSECTYLVFHFYYNCFLVAQTGKKTKSGRGSKKDKAKNSKDKKVFKIFQYTVHLSKAHQQMLQN